MSKMVGASAKEIRAIANASQKLVADMAGVSTLCVRVYEADRDAVLLRTRMKLDAVYASLADKLTSNDVTTVDVS